jgi:hypothetical protein
MRVWIVVIAIAVIVAGVVVFQRMAAPNPSDEEQIAQAILDVKEAVETKDAGGVLKQISDNYDDHTNTKRDIARLVVAGFREPEPFSVHVEPPQITVQGEWARVRFRARFARGPLRDPAADTNLDVVADFAREHRRWRVVSATGWEPAAVY